MKEFNEPNCRYYKFDDVYVKWDDNTKSYYKLVDDEWVSDCSLIDWFWDSEHIYEEL